MYQMLSDGIDYIDLVILCGLVFDQLIILINGQCWYMLVLVNVNNIIGWGSVVIDFNIILLVVIECVEILFDGVIVQYGVDVIVGVINIVFKDEVVFIMVQLVIGIMVVGDGFQLGGSGYW